MEAAYYQGIRDNQGQFFIIHITSFLSENGNGYKLSI